MSLDALAERVMQKVPCPTPIWHESKAAAERASNCPGGCHSTNTVLDPRWKALREAMWEECLVASRRRGTRHDDSDQHTARCDCSGTGFVRRTRAEAAYRQRRALQTLGLNFDLHVDVTGDSEVELYPDGYTGGELERRSFLATSKDADDALSAALMAYMGAQEVT